MVAVGRDGRRTHRLPQFTESAKRANTCLEMKRTTRSTFIPCSATTVGDDSFGYFSPLTVREKLCERLFIELPCYITILPFGGETVKCFANSPILTLRTNLYIAPDSTLVKIYLTIQRIYSPHKTVFMVKRIACVCVKKSNSISARVLTL